MVETGDSFEQPRVRELRKVEWKPKLLPKDFGHDAPLNKGPEEFVIWLDTKMKDLKNELGGNEFRGKPFTLCHYIWAQENLRSAQQEGNRKQILYYSGMVEGLTRAIRSLGIFQDAGLLKQLYDESCALTGVAVSLVPELPSPQTKALPPGK